MSRQSKLRLILAVGGMGVLWVRATATILYDVSEPIRRHTTQPIGAYVFGKVTEWAPPRTSQAETEQARVKRERLEREQHR